MNDTDYFRINDTDAYTQWIEQWETPSLSYAAAQARHFAQIAIIPLIPKKNGHDHLWRYDENGCDKATILRRASPIIGPHFREGLLRATETADFILPLPIDARLSPHALAIFSQTIKTRPEAKLIYADEDRLIEGERVQPRFKTDFDPYLMLGCNAIGAPALYASQVLRDFLLEKIPTPENLETFLYFLALRISSALDRSNIVHIPYVLCHRAADMERNGSIEESCGVLTEYLAGKGEIGAQAKILNADKGWTRIQFATPKSPPRVSIIVPTRDQAHLISRCCHGILQKTSYPDIELILVDNGTVQTDALKTLADFKSDPRVRILRDDEPFNYSRLNNRATKLASGDVFILLNNDTEIIHANWVDELVSLAIRPDVGIVGAKLYYPDGRIQHAGVTFGPQAHHQMRFAPHKSTGPYGELALMRCVSAVTAACLAIRKSVYQELGGLEETQLKIAYNDVDLCLRAVAQGFAIVWTPFAELYHHESATRGFPTDPKKIANEWLENRDFWRRHWRFYENPDPFHNPQLVYLNESVEFASPPLEHPLRFDDEAHGEIRVRMY